MGYDEKEQLDLVKQFRKDRRSLRFPSFQEDPNVFASLMVHLPKEQDDDEEEEGEVKEEDAE